MNKRHIKTLQAMFADPVNGNIPWRDIESLLVAAGCRVVNGPGSSVTFEKERHKAFFHRPHPHREALKYRVKAARQFLTAIGVIPT